MRLRLALVSALGAMPAVPSPSCGRFPFLDLTSLRMGAEYHRFLT
eukprot:CAMPEP_0173299164 /NCGR_PEP_ID=MMETSP1143-20121109/16520_1 /TAXON_ID=483371 /ORGANISM="non described non described, Strain CCMP2298" /LENGTH=44 /DNA_ID= /DNA_START= /DNA_END= /DNA_ORIENTATION=